MHFPPETASVMILARMVATVQQADDPARALDLFMQVSCWTILYNGTVKQGRRMWRGTCCHRMVKTVWEIIVLAFNLLSLVRNTVNCQGYVTGGSKTGNISQDIVSWERLFHKHNVKIGRMVPDTLFWPGGVIFILTKNEQSMKSDRTDDNLRRKYFILNCRWVIWIVFCHVH